MGNELGGREYTDEMQLVILELAQRLKRRDTDHGVSRGLPPSRYMKYYVKAAGILVEAAIHLTRSAPGGDEIKTFSSWLKTLTGLNIVINAADEKLLGLTGGEDAKVALDEHTIKPG